MDGGWFLGALISLGLGLLLQYVVIYAAVTRAIRATSADLEATVSAAIRESRSAFELAIRNSRGPQVVYGDIESSGTDDPEPAGEA